MECNRCIDLFHNVEKKERKTKKKNQSITIYTVPIWPKIRVIQITYLLVLRLLSIAHDGVLRVYFKPSARIWGKKKKRGRTLVSVEKQPFHIHLKKKKLNNDTSPYYFPIINFIWEHVSRFGSRIVSCTCKRTREKPLKNRAKCVMAFALE